jgi:hypothetical protein
MFIIHVYFINIVIKNKEKKQQKINDAIKVTEEICLLLNGTLSCLFWKIREHHLEGTTMTDTNTALMNAFKFKLRYNIIDRTYFQKKSIVNDYDDIVWELDFLRGQISKYEKEKEKYKEFIENHIEILRKKWAIPKKVSEDKKDDKEYSNIPRFYHYVDLPFPYDIYSKWNKIIWIKSHQFTLDLYHKSLNVKELKERYVKSLEQKKKWYHIIWNKSHLFTLDLYHKFLDIKKLKAIPVKPLEQKKNKKMNGNNKQ